MADDPFRSELDALFIDFRSALAFLTRIPGSVFGATGERPAFTRAARIFPLVGGLVGLVGGAVIVVAAALGEPPLIAAGLGVLATMLLTGGMHEDGLADTADGFGGGATAERRLEIMDDSRIGTFGAAALVFSILLRVSALTALAFATGWRAAWCLIAAEAVSRAAMVGLWQALPAARVSGMSQETGPPDQQAMLVGFGIAAVIALATVIPTVGFAAAIVATAIAGGVAYAFTRISANAIGGRTGDTLGACQQLTAVAFLVTVVAFV
ncbi:MAG TPA: adenosylcobinamide-GDP ribazoletransferase [Bauldia sp.]|nr:adenosylcobinamide-GDP ribazoletransferase [Bauldia sp.]